MAGSLEGEQFIGRKAQELRGLLKIKYPMVSLSGVYGKELTQWTDRNME